MTSEPLVSIVITCFNDGIYLPEALESIENSGFTNYEIVVVNDGSTDAETLRILEELPDRVIRIHQPNKGVSVARNAGIEFSKGKYIIPLDADNRVCPAILSMGTKILEDHPEIGMVYGDKELFGEQTGRQPNHKVHFDHILYYAHIDTCALYRKEMWAHIGGYDPLLPTLEDWMFWLNALHGGWRLHYVPEVFFQYRVRSQSKSRRYRKNPEIRLWLTEYFYQKKELFLQKAEESGRIQTQKAQNLRIKWTVVLAYRHLRWGSTKKALHYLRKSVLSGPPFWQIFRAWFYLLGQKLVP